MKAYDVVIVGGGIMGASAAYELAQKGASVALLDQATLPNPQGASVDHSKIFRFAYPEPLYIKMAVESLGLWRKLEQKAETRLLIDAGLLLLGNREGAFETQTYEALQALGLEAEMLKGEAVASRFPQFNQEASAFAAFDPSGGILYADEAVALSLRLAQKFGATIFANERVTGIDSTAQGTVIRSHSGNQWRGEKVLLASGAWTRQWLPEFAERLTTTRQEVVYFEPVIKDKRRFTDAQMNFEIGQFPIFIEMDSGFYGFPIHHAGAMKIGNHHKGEIIDPYAFDENVSAAFIEKCRAFFARVIPALADARVVQSHICMYNNSPDDDFIIDWHPQFAGVLLTTGFSGHGFKFGPLVGQIAAELLLEGQSHQALDKFQLARFM
ncbi:MAG: N-methyl-L-tryptophan oxidase [Acidobacteria bacterium]|nr:N-methyl-L-tryptophan oxidase [Acidobacteriota bacterium]